MKELALKYGCNPNQKPSRIYMEDGNLPIEVVNGRPGYINLLDALNSWQLVKELKAKYPWYASYTIKAGTYPNQDRDVRTTAVKMVMFTRGDMPEDVVYNLTKALWEHIDELGQAQKNLKGLKPEDAVKDIANVPLHPGAEKYYREIGVLK